jgi:uncharacterized protein (UPF0335 family)
MSDTPTVGSNSIAGDRLKSIIDRYERLDQEKKELSSDQKDLMTEASSAGFDKKVIRQLLRIRKMEPADAEEEQTLLRVYMSAIGMQADLFDGVAG